MSFFKNIKAKIYSAITLRSKGTSEIRMSGWGLTSKMLITILVPACLVFTSITIMTYWLTRGAMDEQMVYQIQQQSLQSAEALQNWLKESDSSVNTAANIISSKERSEDELRNILLTVKKSSPVLVNMFVGYDNGKTVDALNSFSVAATDARTLSWYKSVTGETAVCSEVYENKSLGKKVVTVAYPLLADGKRVGVIAAEMNLDKLIDVASKIKVGQTGYAFVLDRSGHYIYHPDLHATEDIFTVENGANAQYGKKYLSGSPQVLRYVFAGVPKIFSSAPLGNSGMAIVLGTSVQEFEGGINRLTGLIIVLSILGLVILSAIVFFVVRRTTKTLGRLSARVGHLAAGDFTVGGQEKLSLSNDEMGNLYQSFKTMRVNTRSLLIDIQTTSEQVASSSQQLTASAEQSAQAANLVASSIAKVAQGTEKQRDAMQAVSQEISQQATAVEQITYKAGLVSQAAQQAAGKAQNGAQSVEEAMGQMNAIEQSVLESGQVVSNLGERSKEIGQIVATISSIASQTNLLALNAAIEAARAGEQGRGFAVVAEEVRKLAEQSQDAAKQIGQLIGEIQSETTRAVEAMKANTTEVQMGSQVVRTSGETFGEISQVVQLVTGQVQEISSAIEKLASGGSQITGAVDILAMIIKDTVEQSETVSAATEEQSAELEEIASASQSLAQVAENLQQAISKFRL